MTYMNDYGTWASCNIHAGSIQLSAFTLSISVNMSQDAGRLVEALNALARVS